MKIRNLIFILLGLIAFYAYRMYLASKELKFMAGNPSSFKWSVNNGIKWVQTINIKNFTAVPIPIGSINVTIIFEGREIGTAVLQAPFIIYGNAISPMKVIINIPYFDLLKLGLGVYDVIITKKLTAGLRGNLITIGLPITIDEQFEVNGKDFLKI